MLYIIILELYIYIVYFTVLYYTIIINKPRAAAAPFLGRAARSSRRRCLRPVIKKKCMYMTNVCKRTYIYIYIYIHT